MHDTESNQLKTKDQFDRYGFSLLGKKLLIQHPKVERFGTLPEYNFNLPSKMIFKKNDLSFIERILSGKISLETFPDYFSEIVSKVFSLATNETNMDSFARFFLLEHSDFLKFRSELEKINKVIMDFAGINFEGNIFMDSSNAPQAFTIAFHELGHSFHKPDAFFNSELRAYFFQELCREIMQDQMEKMGSNVRIGEVSIPKEESKRKQAYIAARALVLTLTTNETLNPRLQKYKKIIFTK